MLLEHTAGTLQAATSVLVREEGEGTEGGRDDGVVASIMRAMG